MNKKKERCVVFYASSEYAPGVANVIIGIEKYSPGLIDNYIFHYKEDDPIKESDRIAFEKISSKVVFRAIQSEPLSMKAHSARWGGYLFLKFDIFSLLEEYRSVLYLEADMLIQGDIAPIFSYGPMAFSRNGWNLLDEFKIGYRSQIETFVKPDTPGCWMGVWLLQDDLLQYGIDYTKELFQLAHLVKDKVTYPVDEVCVALLMAKYNLPLQLLPWNYQCMGNTFPFEKPLIVHTVGKSKFWNNRLLNLFYPEWNDNNAVWSSLGGTVFTGEVEFVDELGDSMQESFQALNSLLNKQEPKGYSEFLKDVVDFAKESDSWNKKCLTKKADIVCAYGLGEYFRDSFDQWDFRTMFSVSYCCDRDPIHGKEVASEYGLEFLDLPKLKDLSNNKRVIVIVFLGNPYPVVKEFLSLGLYAIIAQECVLDKIGMVPDSKEWFQGNQIVETYHMLEDRESKIYFANVVALRMAPHLARYSYKELGNRHLNVACFYKDFFCLGEQEVFCDVGAYIGEVVKLFLNTMNNKFKHIYAIEMDAINFQSLKRNMKLLESTKEGVEENKYTLIHAAAWSEKGTVTYGKEAKAPMEAYTVLKSDFATEVEAVRIDDIVTMPITFLKLNVEGAELDVLKGAAMTIRRDHPKIAVNIAHRIQDLWEIPKYIKQLVPEYRLRILHQSGDIGGTVLYARYDGE